MSKSLGPGMQQILILLQNFLEEVDEKWVKVEKVD